MLVIPLLRQRRFPRSRTSVSAARDLVCLALAEWGVVGLQSDVVLCLSELATNALAHGVPPGRDFHVLIMFDGDVVRVEVRDSGGGTPLVCAPTQDQVSGRGLRIVEELAHRWGVLKHPVGKTVWIEFQLSSL
ncbi:ATP-binding protein [Streptomyces albipurpureus]|uniref:ATP-binding protein n=1 Tax=Streptomyces albipurpureus TaxID=2897419 RepID=UPI0031F31D7C